MNFSEEFYNLIIEAVSEDDIFPDIFEGLQDRGVLEGATEMGKAMKNFLGPPQLLFCPELERGIPLFSYDKLLDFKFYGGLGGLAAEDLIEGLGSSLGEKAPFLGGLGVYGIFRGKDGNFISMELPVISMPALKVFWALKAPALMMTIVTNLWKKALSDMALVVL